MTELLRRAMPLGILLAGGLSACPTIAQVFDERFEDWPLQLTIVGRIAIEHDIKDHSKFLKLVSDAIKGKSVALFEAPTAPRGKILAKELKDQAGAGGHVEHHAVGVSFQSELADALASADIVVIRLDNQASKYVESLQPLKQELKAFLRRGKTLLVDSSTAALFGKFIVRLDNKDSDIETIPGLHLLPDCIISGVEAANDRTRNSMLERIGLHPRTVGILMERNTGLIVAGRNASCLGPGKVTFLIPGKDGVPACTQSLPLPEGDDVSGDAGGPHRERFMLDLTQWRRMAIDQTLEPFPPEKPRTPFVEHGTLLIVGGGGLPDGLMERFVELAGGKERARLVYIPCSESPRVAGRQRIVEQWKRMGVKHATFIHTKDRKRANGDREFLEPLVDATGIWFGGGRQWNFADSYYGTKAHQLMKDVLQRGGVIGGSSAGASVQARYLARATPIGNTSIMAPGYERGGLGFISGVAIDQHFSQRKRQPDMTSLVNTYPQLLGIGIDETTALIVRQSVAEVVGKGRVFFYDRRVAVVPGRPDYIAIGNGRRYDLEKRRVIGEGPWRESTHRTGEQR